MTFTFAFEDIAQGQRRFLGEEADYSCCRVGNSTPVLEAPLASQEGGAHWMHISSRLSPGLAAMTSARKLAQLGGNRSGCRAHDRPP